MPISLKDVHVGRKTMISTVGDVYFWAKTCEGQKLFYLRPKRVIGQNGFQGQKFCHVKIDDGIVEYRFSYNVIKI